MPRLNGPITPMEDASAVSRDAGNPPVRFDVAGAGDGVMDSPRRARSRKRRTQPRGALHTIAPVPDPTGHGQVIGHGERGCEVTPRCPDRDGGA
jgi:hypothetical protein